MEKIKISIKNFRQILTKAEKIIKKGGIILAPTDTVYGLLANAQNKEAVKKVLQIKHRPPKKPLSIFIKDVKAAKKLAFINKTKESFLRKIWPGKITVVLRAKTETLPAAILSKNKKIGLRIPKYKLLNILLKKVDVPLTGTSANISGRPASTKLEEILEQFKKRKYRPDLILDAGKLESSLPSTVIDASEISASTLSDNRRIDLENFKILRKGAVSKKEILGKIKVWK